MNSTNKLALEGFGRMSAVQELHGLLRLRPLQWITVAGLLTFLAGIACSEKLGVLDPDIWWHLKVGDWIVQHHSVPHTGILSRTAANRPWVAYSWGYEVLLSRAHAWFGLTGVGMSGVVLTLAVAYAVYRMLYRISGQFWTACGLATVACYAFLFNVMPRPVFLSIILFTIVLTVILEANRSGRVQPLYILPAIFVVWANIHIQFVYGLFLIGLLVSINLLQRAAAIARIAPRFLLSPLLPARTPAAIFAACVVATCVGPYSIELYKVIYEYSRATFSYGVIHELQAIDFRSYRHYVQLFLTATGFFVVGLQKKIDPFKLALLGIASVVAFRTMRDSWFICIPAAACLADATRGTEERRAGETLLETIGLAAAVALMMLLLARNTDFNSRGLIRAISSQYPVNAVSFLRQNRQPGPLYNTLDWGGFLTWAMPDYPVAIDGRNDLYGDELDRQFYRSQMGDQSYAADPHLNEAGLVLLQKQAPLVSRLRLDSRFVLVYQDQIAVVFTRR
jgi:hypothetical protein